MRGSAYVRMLWMFLSALCFHVFPPGCLCGWQTLPVCCAILPLWKYLSGWHALQQLQWIHTNCLFYLSGQSGFLAPRHCWCYSCADVLICSFCISLILFLLKLLYSSASFSSLLSGNRSAKSSYSVIPFANLSSCFSIT